MNPPTISLFKPPHGVIGVLAALLLVSALAGQQASFVKVRKDTVLRGSGYQGYAGGFMKEWKWDWVDGKKPKIELPASLLAPCPPCLVIYVHGFNTPAPSAMSATEKIAQKFAANGVTCPVVGFIWNSSSSPYWGKAKGNANLYACVLKDLLVLIKHECPNIKIKLIAYSLGTRVALGALSRGACVDQLHLFGAAVDHDSLNKGGEFESAAGNVAGNITSWKNRLDSVLKGAYRFGEGGDRALGNGAAVAGRPGNFREYLGGVHLWTDGLDPEDHGGYLKSCTFLSQLAKNLCN